MKQLHFVLILCLAFFAHCLYGQEASGIMTADSHNDEEAPAITFSRDTLVRSNDSIIIVVTACAPICSSIVIVENAEGDEIGKIVPPIADAIFPEAYIENGIIKWRDNTYMMLDEDEKRWKKSNQ